MILAPVGLCGMQHGDGEILSALAANAAGIPFTLSTMSICSIEDVAEATGKPFWFQLYVIRDRDFSKDILARAIAAKCSALVLTVDTAMLGRRERDIRRGFTLPPKTIREMITGSIDVIIQASRLRDGSRKVTHITEVVGMEGEVVTLQNLIVFEITGEDAHGKIIGRHRSTGIARPRFWERAEYFGETGRLAQALSSAEVHDNVGNPMGEVRG